MRETLKSWSWLVQLVAPRDFGGKLLEIYAGSITVKALVLYISGQDEKS